MDIGKKLQGFGEALAGRGAQWQNAQTIQERNQIVRDQYADQERMFANLADTRKMIAAAQSGGLDAVRQVFGERISALQASGGDPSHSIASFELLNRNPEAWMQDVTIGEQIMSERLKVPSMFSQADTGMASAKTTHYDNGTTMLTLPGGVTEVYAPNGEKVTGDERVRVLKAARNEQISHAADSASSTELAKLKAQLQGRPDVESAVAAAVEQAKTEARQSEEQAVKDVQYGVYSIAFDNFLESVGATKTGPGMGLLPAFTANAQNMETAGALLAPAIRAAFRVKGEGSQSDREFQQFMAMLPDRNTRPEVAVKNLMTLDKMMRTKFGQPLMQDGPQGGSAQPDTGGFKVLEVK